MGWLDRVSDTLGLSGDHSRARQYASAGSALGPVGILGGFLLGRYMDGRSLDQTQQNELSNLDAFGNKLDGTGNWGVNLGDPQSSGVRMGPPSSLAGNAPLLSSGSDGGAPAWWENTTISGADPLGLVPDYNQGGSVPMSHQDRLDYRDGLGMNGAGMSANYGISPMQVGGQNVIIGDNGFDPNGRRVYGGRDFGG